jgi:aspartate carbamoyltransferase catalytic subunit
VSELLPGPVLSSMSMPVAEKNAAQHATFALHLATQRRHLLDIDDIADADVARIFDRAAALSAQNPALLPQTLRGQAVATLFFEPSTRTRLSFELAAQRLGAPALLFDVGRSSLEKSETLYDTVQTLAAMGATMAVVRHADNAVFTGIAQRAELSLLNAGNGTEAHPTQALLDAYTLLRRLGTLAGRTVVINGDILHSRVARSNMKLLPRLGARVILCGPTELVPDGAALGSLAIESARFDDALLTADAIMCLRIQRERHAAKTPTQQSGEGAAHSYLELHGLSEARFAGARSDCLLMHPGPVNRDVEIAGSLVEHPRSLILDQVRNGLYIRMAVMEWIAGVLP